MWFLDGPEYYAPPGARYLAYSNDVRRFIGRLAAERFEGAMPVLYKQMAAMSYQLAQFRWVGGWVGAGGLKGYVVSSAESDPPCPIGHPRRRRRDALAAARMLNRTLVLPTSWCWCDYDWTPHVLEKCKIRYRGVGGRCGCYVRQPPSTRLQLPHRHVGPSSPSLLPPPPGLQGQRPAAAV